MFEIDDDDFDVAEMIAMDRANRKRMAHSIAHPDPRDPDYIDFDEDQEVDDEQ